MFHCAFVAVEDTAPVFDQLYSYIVPDELAASARVGSRVTVPFGRSDAVRTGLIMRISEEESSEYRLKTIIDVEAGESPVSEDIVDLIEFLKQKTYCTYSDALRTVLPKNIRAVSKNGMFSIASRSHLVRYVSADESYQGKISKRQREVLETLAGRSLDIASLTCETGAARETITRMISLGILKVSESVREQDLLKAERHYSADGVTLSPAQEKAKAEISRLFSEKAGSTVLLRGVTSSGKTQIYIKLIKQQTDAGKGVIFLVPEITLSNQTIVRMREVFGSSVAIINSALSATERTVEWEKIRSGECPIVIGTRSAVFSPVSDIGLIILDEEQEDTYNSEQNPKYSAVEVAQYRVKRHGGSLLLASATPSVEHFYHAVSGRIGLVELDERFNSMPLPDVSIVDMRREAELGNTTCISKELADAVRNRLEKKEQTLLLLNRRGYNTVSICTSCRQVLKCPSCDTPLVHHKREGKLVCHYCGHSEPFGIKCPECGGELRQQGFGTEKIEETMGLLFPDASITRLDLDVTSRKNSSETILRDFAGGKYDILIGTQMIAKGLDFANVTLVGVISADQMLLLPNYNSVEKAFSTLTQVVGRGGRGEKTGEAIIQTYDPSNPVIRLASCQDYRAFYEAEIVLRKTHLYPPFCRMCTVSITGPDESQVDEASHAFIDALKSCVRSEGENMPLKVLGPVPMRVAYINTAFRYKVNVKGPYGNRFRDIIYLTVKDFYKKRKYKNISIATDFNNNDG